MKRTLLASLFAFVLPVVNARASEDAPVDTPPAAAAAPVAVVHARLVGVILSSAQALIWDEDRAEYVLHRVGEELSGGRIVELEADHLIIDRGESREVIEIAAPPETRVAAHKPRRMPAMIVTAAPDVPTTVAAAQAAVDRVVAAQAAAPVVNAPAMVATAAQAAVAPDAAAAAPAMVAPVVPAPQAAVATPVAIARPAPAAPVAPVAAAPTPAAISTPVVAPTPAVAPAPVVAPAPIVAPAPAPAAAPAPVAAPAVVTPAAAPVSAAATGPLVLQRAELDRELGDFGSLSQQLQVTAQPEGGFRLSQVRGGCFFERIGLRANDVVVRVDGRAINGVDDAAAAYAWLRVANAFTVDVVRDGRPLTLRYVIS